MNILNALKTNLYPYEIIWYTLLFIYYIHCKNKFIIALNHMIWTQAGIITLCRLWRSVKCWSNVGDRLLITNVGTMLGNNWPNLIPTVESNFSTVDVQGLSNVYSAPVVNCKIPTMVQCWEKISPTFFRLWKN